MECKYCSWKCRRSGKQRNGAQRYYCGSCKKYQQKDYLYPACAGVINPTIQLLVCESVGVRGIARVLKIATNTVLSRIRKIASGITKPVIPNDQPIFEVDELWTYIGRKDNEYWLAYGLDKATGRVVDFVIGKRTKGTLKLLIDSLLNFQPKKIRTDNLTIYQRLIPKTIHRRGAYCINHIERKNLSIRTHLKRLSRRTICFTRNITLLESCLKIYFWAKGCMA
jgi:IS1 family transposase/transposase-like protein